jgi:uroporphyrinogen decarboxylase
VDHLIRREFYIWDEALARWKKEGLPADWKERNLFNFDVSGEAGVNLNLGWCEPPFVPAYEEKVIQDDGTTEIIQDWAGRWLRVFKGRRHGFMPTYLKHPVTGPRDWEENVAPRLDPRDERRYAKLPARCAELVRLQRDEGLVVTQGFIGGYMYLRALLGPEELLYAFVDQPDLIHTLMRRWVEVMDAGLARIQALVEIDLLRMAEDICYNHGSLISPQMFREFHLPYYQTVVRQARARQARKLHFYVDTDGWAEPVIPLFLEAGMSGMGPFEVAAGCDLVAIARQYPELYVDGGIDKRVLAQGPREIEAFLQRVIPPLVARGGYVPTCDHGVPDDVSFENYVYYRKRMCELDH